MWYWELVVAALSGNFIKGEPNDDKEPMAVLHQLPRNRGKPSRKHKHTSWLEQYYKHKTFRHHIGTLRKWIFRNLHLHLHLHLHLQFHLIRRNACPSSKSDCQINRHKFLMQGTANSNNNINNITNTNDSIHQYCFNLG